MKAFFKKEAQRQRAGPCRPNQRCDHCNHFHRHCTVHHVCAFRPVRFSAKIFGTFNAPTLAVVLYAIYSRKVTPLAAKAAFCVHIPLYWLATLLLPQVHYLYFFAILFPFDVLVMYVITKRHPRTELIEIQEKAQVDMTPWKYGKLVAVLSILALLGMYFVFSPLCLAKI